MALEQLVAFLNDIPQASLGAPSFTGPDMFPLLDSSDLCTEHKLLSELFDEVIASGELGYFDLQHYAAGTHILESSPESMGRFALACVERSFAVESHLCGDTVLSWDQRQFLEFGTADTFRTLLRRNAEVDPAYSVTLTRWLAATPVNKPAWVYTTVLGLLKRQFTPESLPDDLRNVLIEIWAPVKLHGGFGFGKSVREFIGDGPWDFVLPVDPFADVAVTDLLAMDRKLRDAWQVLLAHCKTATSSKPTTKWSKLTDELLVAVGAKNFRDSVGRWFPHVGRPRPGRKVYRRDEHAELLHAQNSLVLRGLLWTCTLCADRNLCRSLGEVAKAAYQKIPGIGPRDLKAGNAAVYALGQIGTLDSVAALAVLKTRVKLLNAQKGIEKALTATAERVGIPREELEEMSVPDYGLTDVGVRSETLGEFTAELRVAGRKSELHWFKPDGTEQKTVPKSLKDDFGDELKEFKQAARDIEKMIPAQAARIEQTYLQQKEWSFPIWADRYLNHPLVGTLTRRLIWKLQRGRNHATAIWADDGLVDQRGKTVNWADEKTTVRLWHPL
ncbi:MAG: DUF4132 domain-containing protein, partial [Planctomycetota bacterium]|nr:DUF4132 domain-containing protein [Planctomycetota bacterium]